jgi:hypothetical protein
LPLVLQLVSLVGQLGAIAIGSAWCMCCGMLGKQRDGLGGGKCGWITAVLRTASRVYEHVIETLGACRMEELRLLVI